LAWSILGARRFKFVKIKSLGLSRALNFYIVIKKELLKKSSQELLHQVGQYLARSIPRSRRFKFVQIKPLGSCMAPPQGLKLYIVIYGEMLKKSSQELLHQIGQYLT